VEIARNTTCSSSSTRTYHQIIYNGKKTVPLSDIIGEVPGISMKGISKEFPWPGSRCGWMEVYNAERDETFSRYIDAILNQKMSEVCSTTLPQMAIPRIMDHPEYQHYLDERVQHYEKLSNLANKILTDLPYVMVNRTCGAFYMTVVFNDAVLNGRQHLKIKQDDIRAYIEKLVAEPIEFDKRFVYYLLGATGICVIPLTSFFTDLPGFRMTLLDRDEAKFEKVVRVLAEKIVAYVESAR
jgi:aspartate/methionine/tyrosine aminotransferase